ncbi:MAG: molecular chaperone TorD family protein [Planctomycetota bacterium]|nr:molecular chaperone TorD family protein [Planctomycetota bacterium]
MSSEEGLSYAGARATLLELVAQLLIQEIDNESRDALRHPDIVSVLDKLEPGVKDYLGDGDWTEQQWDECAADFCGLFLSNKNTAPFASAWYGEEASVVGAAQSELVDAWCGLLGISISGGPWGNVPKDHIAVLVGLMAHALHVPGPEGEALAQDILERGLDPWVDKFTKAVLGATDNPLYRSIVRLLSLSLKNEEPV